MIPGLDGLRAVAFLIVFGFHVKYLPFGWMGVQLFFVLSGYLITGILLRMRQNLSISDYFVKFYGRRFLRIFPLYYFYLFLMIGLAFWLISIRFKPAVMGIFLDQVWYALFYVYDFFSAYSGYIDSGFLDHLWSLSVEEQFYIFWPLLIFLVPEKRLKQFFIAGIMAGPAFRIIIFLIDQAGVFPALRGPAPLATYFLPFSHVDAFLFGAYISRFPIKNARQQFLLVSFLVPLLGFSTYYASTGRFSPLSMLGYEITLPHAYQFLWAYTLLNYWFALLIYCVVSEQMFVRWLEWAPLRYLGKISYGLYVYHYPMIWIMDQVGGQLGLSGRELSLFILFASFIGTLVTAFLSFNFIEKPFLKLKDRFVSYST